MKRFLIPALMLGLAACTYPHEQVRTVDSRPSLVVVNAPPFSTLAVDGIVLGQANDYAADKAIRVEPGRHVVRVFSEDQRMIHEETVFVSGAVVRQITLPEGKK